MQSGQIIDATFVPVPIQRNSRSDNETIKQGDAPSSWTDKKAAHKDTHERWTKKNVKATTATKTTSILMQTLN